MADILASVSTRHTPQSQPADPRQIANAAGGYTFALSAEERLRRFLTLGTTSGTYYTSPRDLTAQNAAAVFDLARADHRLLVDTIVEISLGGRAPQQNPTLFALAIAASTGTDEERRYALSQLAQVARTGTHLFLFARYIEQFRGWGRSLRRAVGSWYTDKDAEALAFQAVKYRQREGWSHRDLLRLSHPHTADPALQATLRWITQEATSAQTPALIEGFLRAQEPGADVPALITEYGLSWEMLPDRALGSTATWDALLERGIPQTALLRQLPRLTRLGVLPALGGRTAEVAAQLADRQRLQRARVHPISVLVAQRTYAAGQSLYGSAVWQPNRTILDALDTAFYQAFDAVEPAGVRMLVAVDVSGSMAMSTCGSTPLTPREAATALTLVQLATEPQVDALAFTGAGGWDSEAELAPLPVSAGQRLDDAISRVSDMPFGPTDCSLPMRYALEQGIEVDTFVVYTDNETWAGGTHPHEMLRTYRERTGIVAKLIVVGMTAIQCSIADPDDPGMLDIAGFDASLPGVIAGFARGF